MAIHYANTIADMLISPAVLNDTIIVGGYYTFGDGGGGNFLVVAPGGTPDNGLLFNGGARYYQRIVNTPYISVKWFGAYGNNFDPDDDAINRTFRSVAPGNTILIDGEDASRTRIYFPAGIYVLENPIEDVGAVPYEIAGLEIVGERAVLKTVDPVVFGTNYAMWLKVTGSAAIRGITFKAFNRALAVENDTEVMNFAMDCVNFEDHNDLAIRYECSDGTFTIDNSIFTNCNRALLIQSGKGVIRTSKFNCSGWSANDSTFIYINFDCDLSIKNCEFFPPHSPYNVFAYTAAWIGNAGCFRAVNTRFHQPPKPMMNNSIGHIILNLGTPKQWDNNAKETRIILRDCFCDSSGPAVKLDNLVNVMVFRNNVGFGTRSLLFQYTGFTPLQTLLDQMFGLMSIELDSIPQYGTGLWRANRIYRLSQPNNVYPVPLKDQLKFLPYFRVNAGLDSFGYAEDFNFPSVPSVVKFFMGRQSYDSTDSNNSAIYGDCSFEIKLTNVTTYDPVSGNYTEGNICLYNTYRVNCRVVGGVTIIDSYPAIDLDPDPYAPILWKDPADGILKITTYRKLVDNQPERYGIYYQIRNLIPPAVEVFPG